MSKKPKAKTKAKAKAKPAALEQINAPDFERLVRRCKSLKQQAQSTSGEVGELIKSAIENKHLDRVAFAMFRKLESMPTPKLATTLACLDYYVDIGGLEQRIDNEPPLEIKRQEAGEKEEASNVTALPVKQAQAAE